MKTKNKYSADMVYIQI